VAKEDRRDGSHPALGEGSDGDFNSLFEGFERDKIFAEVLFRIKNGKVTLIDVHQTFKTVSEAIAKKSTNET
jgi:hypothetical protein